METFVWNDCFITGLQEVDDQHRALVDLINAFGRRLTEQDLEVSNLDELVAKLFDYAGYHFSEEEHLMQAAGLDRRHVEQHERVHREFLDDIQHLQREISRDGLAGARRLHEFLIHWLAYHILGIDQVMAEQVAAIGSGRTPDQAYAEHSLEVDPKTEPLLATLNALFKQMSERNRQLRDLNESLEEKVEQRTQALLEANRHLEELALTDSLTGLPNRRQAMIALKALWRESTSHEIPLACLMIDADQFKEVNDTYGHDAGDRVLKELALALKHSVRTDDQVCRLGGDEFFVICPDTDLDGAMLLGEKLRTRVAALKVPTGPAFWFGSISVGVGIRQAGMPGTEALIKLADEGVYAAKRAGRNCVSSAG